jgi:hypothetical protein
MPSPEKVIVARPTHCEVLSLEVFAKGWVALKPSLTLAYARPPAHSPARSDYYDVL